MCHSSLHGGNCPAQCPAAAGREISGLYLSKSLQLAGQLFSHCPFRGKGWWCASQNGFRQLAVRPIRPWSALAGVKLVPSGRMGQKEADPPKSRTCLYGDSGKNEPFGDNTKTDYTRLQRGHHPSCCPWTNEHPLLTCAWKNHRSLPVPISPGHADF